MHSSGGCIRIIRKTSGRELKARQALRAPSGSCLCASLPSLLVVYYTILKKSRSSALSS